MIKDQQAHYYQVLEEADNDANSTVFVEFMLDIIDAALSQSREVLDRSIDSSSDQVGDQVGDQVKELLAVMDDEYWSAQALMTRLRVSRKPTFRKDYLNPALEAGLVVMKYPESPRSPRQAYRKQQANRDNRTAKS